MSDEREAPRGHSVYLWTIDVLPDSFEPMLRRAADEIRHWRSYVRWVRRRWIRQVRRWTRRIRRPIRQIERRFTRFGRRTGRLLRRASNRWFVSGVHAGTHQPEAGADQSSLLQSQRHRSGRLLRRVFPPIVVLQGSGPTVLVDALGRSTSEILAALPAMPDRAVVATNDPNLGPLRDAQVVYEFVPSAMPDGIRPADSLTDRIAWIDYVYGIDEIQTLPTTRRLQ